MKEYLTKGIPEKGTKERIYYLIYKHRIQRRINRELDNLLWLAVNFPEILLYEDSKNEYGHIRKPYTKHDSPKQRLRKLLMVVKALNPKCDVELTLKNLEGDLDKCN